MVPVSPVMAVLVVRARLTRYDFLHRLVEHFRPAVSVDAQGPCLTESALGAVLSDRGLFVNLIRGGSGAVLQAAMFPPLPRGRSHQVYCGSFSLMI